MSHVVVIGAGVGGLAAAIRLAARGVRVTLLEKLPRVGGKLNYREIPHPGRPADRPFRFDTGPSLLTLPFVFKDLFEAAGVDVRDHLPIVKLDPVSRFVWQDGRSLELHADEARMLQSIRAFAPNDADGFARFYDYGRRIWALAGESFLSQSPEAMIRGDGSFDPVASLRALSVPFRIGMFRKFASVVDRHVADGRLREVLYQYATYSGASPFLAPATLAVIPFCELHFGGWYVPGGMYRIATALEAVARGLGVEVRCDAAVRRILTVSDKRPKATRVIGVELESAERLSADAVVCNADAIWAYRHLIDPAHRPHMPDAKLDRLEPGGSGMCLLLGVEGRYEQVAHHQKFMPDDYRSDLDAMFVTRSIPSDPCIYVCRSTATDPTQAPDGCDNLFVLVSAPPLGKGSVDWEIEGPRYEQQVIRTLEDRWGLTDLSRRIVVRERITPVQLRGWYNAHAGAIYGLSSNGIRNAFVRPPNREKRVRGLHFAGGSTHPGGGLPLVAWSGKIAAEGVLGDLA